MNPQPTPSRLSKYIAPVVLVAIIAVFILISSKKPAAFDNNANATNTNTAAGNGQTAGNQIYLDGTYTAVGHYVAPSGPEQVGVELTLKDDVVTAVTIQKMGDNPTTQQFQAMFTSGIEAEVVGKRLDEISVTKVSGSSLTPKGFTDALAQIKTEAQA